MKSVHSNAIRLAGIQTLLVLLFSTVAFATEQPEKENPMITCDRFLELTEKRDDPRLMNFLAWIQGIAATLNGMNSPDRKIEIPVTELEKSLKDYCARHPRATLFDAIFDFIFNQSHKRKPSPESPEPTISAKLQFPYPAD